MYCIFKGWHMTLLLVIENIKLEYCLFFYGIGYAQISLIRIFKKRKRKSNIKTLSVQTSNSSTPLNSDRIFVQIRLAQPFLGSKNLAPSTGPTVLHLCVRPPCLSCPAQEPTYISRPKKGK